MVRVFFFMVLVLAPPSALAVVGGVKVDDPNSVLLILNGEYGATGTRIGKSVVLCAGHSVVDRPIETIQVFQVDAQGQRTEYAVEAKKVNPAYLDTGEREFDIALLKLDRPMIGEPRAVEFKALKRGMEFSLSGFGADVMDGPPTLERRGGTNILPTKDEPLEYLKSLAWERHYGIARFYGRLNDQGQALGEYVSPDSGDSGLGLIQSETLRAVFSGSHGDAEVRKASIAAVPLWSRDNQTFLRNQRRFFPFRIVP